MKGTKHDAYVNKDAKGVELANRGDSHYYCVFETPEELLALIEELKLAGKEAFGPGKTPGRD